MHTDVHTVYAIFDYQYRYVQFCIMQLRHAISRRPPCLARSAAGLTAAGRPEHVGQPAIAIE